jgi:hypothetical protein
MDQLYYYVRKMDDVIGKMKVMLNDLAEKYEKEDGPNYASKMMNHYMRSHDKNTISHLLSYDKYTDDNSESSSDPDDCELEDDESQDEDNEKEESTDQCAGDMLEKIWVKRSKGLRTDVAIAGWMCSPRQDIMYDCNKNHTGEHRSAVTRLFRKWFIHEVVRSTCVCNV